MMTFNASKEGLEDTNLTSHLSIICWTLLILTTIIANAGLLAIIHYERFGGDPQKRSLINRLSSDMIWCIILIVDIAIISHVGREGQVLSDCWIIKLLYARKALCFCMFMFINLHSLVIYLQVVVFRRVMEINDELCSSCMRRAVCLSCFGLSFATPLDILMVKNFGLESALSDWNCTDIPTRCVHIKIILSNIVFYAK